MSATVTLSRHVHIALWVARVLVAIPFFIAAGLEGLSSPTTLAEMDLVWIPNAPLWLVRAVAGIEGLDALGLDLAAGSQGDLTVKAVVLALTLFILWMRLRASGPKALAP